ncbi:MAG: hypothetical protein MUC74_01275 [Ideonella sp.]|jgi:uncharacterized membrane protein|nr:hypothetical protein [Ideonella sp.]
MLSEAVVVGVATALALWLRPWRMFRGTRIAPAAVLACLLLPWLWASPGALPGGLVLQLSGACLLVLVLGWPMAILVLWPVALAGGWLADASAAAWLARLAWHGIAPATLGLALGAAVRRWLPHHLFVYILGRGFFATLLATVGAGVLSVAWQGVPPGIEPGEVLVGHWLIAWGEAMATGMIVAVLVAFRPEWLPTYSDRLYLPGPDAGR